MKMGSKDTGIEVPRSLALFGSLKITRLTLFKESSTVEIFAAPFERFSKERYPESFKFTYKGFSAANIASAFQVSEVVHIKAEPEAYEADVYGKRGKPIKYPDGTPRKTTKTRFQILEIYKGPKIGRWR